MGEPTHTSKGFPGPPKPAAGTGQHDTMLLGDLPEASGIVPETMSQPISAPHLSSAALAALAQRYEILGEAGHGSMGNVYKARDRETGEIVALKLLKPEIASDQAMMDRFKNELLFARKITHKNVCRVHEFNRIGGIAYTSMEFVEGESLRSVLNRFGGLPSRKAIGLVLQICSGLEEAHAQGIVHRDLKPENIMVDAQGNVKIMDFGIARSMEAVTRLTGSMVGTPAYMAPEQVAGKPVDYRTDVYSLGLILYEMFTGTPAFRADNAVAVALKQMRESPVPPHEIDPQIPVGIERAILKCLEKEPAKRFPSIGELESAIRGQGTPCTQTATSVATAPASAARSTRPTLRLPSRDIQATPAPRKRGSAVLWLALIAFLALVALAGARSARIRRTSAAIPPPAPLPAPEPPAFAFDIPARPAAEPKAPPVEAAQPKPVPPKPAKRLTLKPTEPALPPQDVQQRADKAFGEKQRGKSLAATSDHPGFIWVSRFERQDRAQDAARKVRDLGGFQARVATRWDSTGKFFVVWAGPVASKSLPDSLDWLHAQGFAKAHVFKSPAGETLGRRKQGEDAGWGQNPGQAPNP
jgi:Protein kinase domain